MPHYPTQTSPDSMTIMNKVFGVILVGSLLTIVQGVSGVNAYDLTLKEDSQICAYATKSVSGNLDWNTKYLSFVKEAKRRGLSCFVPTGVWKSPEEKRAEEKKATEAIKAEEKAAEKQSALKKKSEIYQKSLRLDKCLLEVFDKFPEQEQSSAEYLCRVTAEFRDNKIMVNCLMDKGMNKKRRLVDAAVNVCVSIAEKPSTMDMLRYGNPLSEYLRMFDSAE